MLNAVNGTASVAQNTQVQELRQQLQESEQALQRTQQALREQVPPGPLNASTALVSTSKALRQWPVTVEADASNAKVFSKRSVQEHAQTRARWWKRVVSTLEKHTTKASQE